MVSPRISFKISDPLRRGIWLLVLAVGGSATIALAQSSVAPPIGNVPATLRVSENLRRLPAPDDPINAPTAFGERAPPALEGCDFSGAFAATTWQANSGIQDVDHQEEIPLPRAGQWLETTGELIQIAPDPLDPWRDDPFGRYSYDGSGNPESLHWIPGSGNRMGILTLPFTSFKEPEEGKNSFSLEATWHLVGGPQRTDMPPHLWDFAARLGRRNQLDSFWSYDIAVRAGWFSDFEGSARKGLRFPGHGVLYYTPSDQFQLQIGLDVLDRDDIACLPVFGAVFKPHRDLRLDAVFPQPRIAYRVAGERWLYLTGEMDGGTWAIKRAEGTNDVATYRDYRICLGIEGQERSVTEVGFVFNRHLEYRSGTPSYAPLNTTILRHVVSF